MEAVLKEQLKAEYATIKKMLMELLQALVARQGVRAWRLQLFSTQAAKLFCRYFIIGLATLPCLYFKYRFASHANDNRHALQEQPFQHGHAERAWKELYQQVDGR